MVCRAGNILIEELLHSRSLSPWQRCPIPIGLFPSVPSEWNECQRVLPQIGASLYVWACVVVLRPPEPLVVSLWIGGFTVSAQPTAQSEQCIATPEWVLMCDLWMHKTSYSWFTPLSPFISACLSLSLWLLAECVRLPYAWRIGHASKEVGRDKQSLRVLSLTPDPKTPANEQRIFYFHICRNTTNRRIIFVKPEVYTAIRVFQQRTAVFMFRHNKGM